MILNSPYITGSLTVTGNTTLMGALTVTGSLSGTAATASFALTLGGTGSVGFATTGAFSATSGSASSRLTQIEQVYATTGSNSFRATQSITGSLTVTGQIIAQTLNVQQVTSSIVYSSGSNVFGCDINSRQTFTGSFYQTGSIAIFNSCVGIGTTNPANILHISSSLPRLIVDTSNRYAVFNLYANGGEKSAYYWDNVDNLTKFESCTGYLFMTSGSRIEALRINNCGLVGFNTDTFATTGLAGSPVFLRSSCINAGQTSMVLQDYRKCNRWAINGQDGPDDFKLAIYSTPTNSNDFTRRFSIQQDGNISIGSCTGAGAKLTVVGAGTGAAFSYGNTVANNLLHTVFYGGWTGIGMDASTAGMRIAGDISEPNPIVQFGYYKGGTVNNSCWCQKALITTTGVGCFSGAVCSTLVQQNAAPFFFATSLVDGAAANGQVVVTYGTIAASRGLHGYCTTTGRMCACYDGVYSFNWTYLYRSNTNACACIDDGYNLNGTFYFGGNRYRTGQLSWGDGYVAVKGAVSVYLAKGQYFEVKTDNNGDTCIKFYGAPTWGYLSGAYIG